MTVTGWTGEDPDAGPAMPVTQMLMARREHQTSPLEIALARSAADDARAAREAAASSPDPDEYCANLVSRGYAPGMISQLSMRLADTVAELAGEEDKLEKAARRAERTRQMHERGQIDVSGVIARWQDTDEGDENRVRQLERRAESLRGQIREASEAMAPQRVSEADGVEAAASRARTILAEVARGQSATSREAPPFGSASRSAERSTEHTGPDCWVCAQGRRTEARAPGPYPPGAVITTGYREIAR